MYLFFDTETTGLPTKGQYDNPKHENTPKLVELAAVLCDKDGQELDNLSTTIKPYGFTIPKEASDVHGITTEKAEAEGTELDWAMKVFNNLVAKSTFLIAHNASYDRLVLSRVQLDLAQPMGFNKTLLCTKEITTDICKIPNRWGKYKWPTLQEAHNHLFGHSFDKAHSALADVRATARVFFELIKRNLYTPPRP